MKVGKMPQWLKWKRKEGGRRCCMRANACHTPILFFTATSVVSVDGKEAKRREGLAQIGLAPPRIGLANIQHAHWSDSFTT